MIQNKHNHSLIFILSEGLVSRDLNGIGRGDKIIAQTHEEPKKILPKHKEETGIETQESKAKENNIPHIQTLEDHHALSPDQRHRIRSAVSGPPEHKQHLEIHPTV